MCFIPKLSIYFCTIITVSSLFAPKNDIIMKNQLLLKTLALVACLSCAGAYDFESGDLYYNITGDNTVSVTYKNTNYNSYSGNVTIPSTVTYGGQTYDVDAVGIEAFKNCSGLTSVSFPNTLKEIYRLAFQKCTRLTKVIIPNSVTYVGGMVFSGCTNLKTVVLGENCRFRGHASWSNNIFLRCPSLFPVTSMSAEPWEYLEPMFDQYTYDNAVLYVPRGSIDGYRAMDIVLQVVTIAVVCVEILINLSPLIFLTNWAFMT